MEHRHLAWLVAIKLRQHCSPQPIVGWQKYGYPDDVELHLSHEAIYKTLFIQERGALKKELTEHLRRTRVMLPSRHHTQKTDNHGQISDAVSISERPAALEDRAVPGRREGDLLFGVPTAKLRRG